MEKVRYMISDAAAMAGVETHVLRYWEEELDLTIPRNEMGHRYYTRENILEFQKIKELKEQGYQLKAIRMIIHSQDVEKAQALYRPDADTSDGHSANDLLNMPSGCQSRHTFVSSHKDTENGLSAEERMAQFRELMSDIVGRAIAQNNEELSLSISQEVRETVLKSFWTCLSGKKASVFCGVCCGLRHRVFCSAPPGTLPVPGKDNSFLSIRSLAPPD